MMTKRNFLTPTTISRRGSTYCIAAVHNELTATRAEVDILMCWDTIITGIFEA